jgi:hypothetical protein
VNRNVLTAAVVEAWYVCAPPHLAGDGPPRGVRRGA